VHGGANAHQCKRNCLMTSRVRAPSRPIRPKDRGTLPSQRPLQARATPRAACFTDWQREMRPAGYSPLRLGTGISFANFPSHSLSSYPPVPAHPSWQMVVPGGTAFASRLWNNSAYPHGCGCC
jgi:hypothetical protein